MNDNKLFYNQVSLKKETSVLDGANHYKALGWALAVPKHVDLSTEVLGDKTIVMTASSKMPYPSSGETDNIDEAIAYIVDRAYNKPTLFEHGVQ